MAPPPAAGAKSRLRPHGIFIGPDDTVYCTDDFGHTVRAFTTDGKPRFTLGVSGQPSDTGATSIDYRTIQRAGPPLNFPTNLAVGPHGDLYVSDGVATPAFIASQPDGRLIHSWGEPGVGRASSMCRMGLPSIPRGSSTSPIVRTAGFSFLPMRENT